MSIQMYLILEIKSEHSKLHFYQDFLLEVLSLLLSQEEHRQSNPNIFAEIFIIIAPYAFELVETSGNSFANSGKKFG